MVDFVQVQVMQARISIKCTQLSCDAGKCPWGGGGGCLPSLYHPVLRAIGKEKVLQIP